MCTHCIKRGSTYYFRRKIPLDLQARYDGKTEIMFSLETKDKSQARVLVARHTVRTNDEFAELRNEHQTSPSVLETTIIEAPAEPKEPIWADLTYTDIDALAQRYLGLYRRMRQTFTARGELRTFEIAMKGIIADADEYLKEGTRVFGETDEPTWSFEAKRNAAKAALKSTNLKNVVVQISTQQVQTPARLQPTIPALKHLTTPNALIKKWALETTPRDKTVKTAESIWSIFEHSSQIKHIEIITRADVIAFKDKLVLDKKTPQTTNKYLRFISLILNYGYEQQLIDTNPASKISVKVKREAKRRVSYDLNNLNLVFNSPIYTQGARPKGGAGEASYWFPLIGLFTGARLGEICQLTKADVYQKQDDNGKFWWMFSFNEEGEGELKNEISIRHAPVHDVLIKLGFLEYIASLKTSASSLIFPDLNITNSDKTGSNSWSKWYGKWLRETLKIMDRRIVFHSFRHTFKEHTRRCGIPEEVSDAISGHANESEGRKYGGDMFPIEPLVEAMKKYDFPKLEIGSRTVVNSF